MLFDHHVTYSNAGKVLDISRSPIGGHPLLIYIYALGQALQNVRSQQA